ncbi:MAG TPA: ubiquinol-cytochrome c reductase iron-sulfur subunit [Anaerolineales bacterium]|nr:ubiquinol-cytochrome c reductase iron-sulfur subunit [Anaerolineales bacterium]
MTKISRRDFLKVSIRGLIAASGVLALGGLIRFLNYRPDPPPPARFDVGPAFSFPMNSRTVIADIPAILIHANGKYSALSLICTHLGCTVQEEFELLVCPCHGSQYTLDGKVTRGPARNPLQTLRVEVTSEGNVVIYVDRS